LKITDTHIHLYADEYQPDLPVLIESAVNAGVQRFLLPNIDAASISPMLELCDQLPGRCYPMIGLHPCYVKEDFELQLKNIKSAFLKNRHRVIAIGEIGLDFHWDLTFRVQQEEAFLRQLEWAEEFKLPVSIHSRESTSEIIELIRKFGAGRITGVFHCFSGTVEQAKEVIELGFYIGIGGVVTFKKSNLPEILTAIPHNYLLLETDGPYLAPVPFRGKRNEPSYLVLVAQKVAGVLGMDLGQLAEITSRNAEALFSLESGTKN